MATPILGLVKRSKVNVSVVIPLYVISPRFFSDLKKFQNLDYKKYELIIVSDKKIKLPKINIPIKLILTGKKSTGPAEKRDLALRSVKGEFCAFIDDDAYPDPAWLTKAVKWFKNPDIVAVGGAGLTPPEDKYWQKIGGFIIESFLCSGGIQDRYYKPVGSKKQSPPRFVDDWPAYNLIVRTSVLKKVGGYGSTFYGGEDTLLCLKIIKHGLIIADTNIMVHHHRREFPLKHLQQIAGVGLHRGYFFMKYPETSRVPFYLLPSILTISFFVGLLVSLYLWQTLLLPFSILFLLAWFLGALSVYRHRVDAVSSAIAGLGIILTHIVYGIYFIKGVFTKTLTR